MIVNATRTPAYVDRRPPPATDNSSKYAAVIAATAVAVLAMAGAFWAMAATGGTSAAPEAAEAPAPAPEPEPTAVAPEPTPTPEPVSVPPAPGSNQLTDNEWVLARYAIVQEAGNLTITGTVKNLAAAQRSTTMRVFVYVDGSHVATGTGDVVDVPGGGSLEVSLPSDTAWTPGNKVLLVAAPNPA